MADDLKPAHSEDESGATPVKMLRNRGSSRYFQISSGQSQRSELESSGYYLNSRRVYFSKVGSGNLLRNGSRTENSSEGCS